MADFKRAYLITMANEGGYNPGIGEKETYKGIDRGANPHCPIWPIVEAVKTSNRGISTKRMNEILGADIKLQEMIADFYKVNYWHPLNLDAVHDQQLANNLFDCSVNQGEGRARLIFQNACNYVMHGINSLIKKLTVDGVIGAQSIAAINAMPADAMHTEINKERDAWYRTARQFPQWGKVWEARLIPYNKAA